MGRFKTITAICLTVIIIMIAGNIWYLHGLYDSIKAQTLQAVTECVRRADILEIINRLKVSSYGQDDSFIKFTLVVEGEKSKNGGYDYPNILGRFDQTLSETFHVSEDNDRKMAPRDYDTLDSLFIEQLNSSGLYPERAVVRPATDPADEGLNGLWSVDFAISDKQPMIYKAYFSPLHGHILHQMSGIIATSAAIILFTGFLIFYLLHWVGRLRTIEQMKDDFTHNMTHELKTPVAVAFSAADSMLRYYDQSDEARNKQFLRIIMQRLDFLSGMIEKILSMSMERFRTIKLNMETVALKPIAAEIAAMMEVKADKQVSFHIEIPENLTIQTDPLHLGNILSNIIDNAIKYSGDSVDISISADNSAITVSDNGIGIDRADLPYIFDKFYRVTTGNLYEVGGYGLGLYYVRQITGLLGWSIEVASKPGQGTKFTIKFNVHEKRHDSIGRG